MYSEDHYLSKIERNTAVLDKAPVEIKEKCASNIKWARDLAARLDLLDYDQRDIAIKNMNEVLDEDYVDMGFELSQEAQKMSR